MNELWNMCEEQGVLVAAHRGVCGANIPCNTIPAFEIAVRSGAAILEMDLFRSADGDIFIFHTGKERHLLGQDLDLTRMSSVDIRKLRLLNADHNVTSCGIDSFDDVLEQFKGRCLLNLDRCGGFLKDVVRCVKRHGMGKQILLKTAPEPRLLKEVEECAPEYMYLPIYMERDMATERILGMNINFVGAELVFENEASPVAAVEYIDSMRKKGFVLWGNSLLYDVKVPLAGGHSDDVSLLGNPEDGWGWLAERGFGIIQTDWAAQCAGWLYREGRAKSVLPSVGGRAIPSDGKTFLSNLAGRDFRYEMCSV